MTPPATVQGPRRVGIDASQLRAKRTGIANYVVRLLEPLCRLHPDVEFVLYSNETIHLEPPPNVRLRVTPRRRHETVWHQLQLPRFLRQDRIEVFWGTNRMVPLWSLHRFASVVTVHDLVARFAPETQPSNSRWKQRVLQPLCSRAATRVVAVSQATASDMAAAYGRTPDAVIHPLAPSDYRPARPEAALPVLRKHGLERGYLLCVGTLEPRKNVQSLIKAYLGRRHAGVVLPPLVLVGGDGWNDDEVVAAVVEGERAGMVKRLGYVDDAELPLLYSACAAFLMPSLYEGFGMPLLEAQMCGAPVIHGQHASMVEAAGGLGVAVAPATESLAAMLDALAEGRCPLACRLPSAIDNDPERAAEALWNVFVSAHAARQARGLAMVSGARGRS
jgi:glycosyltransferase involved in cell wall biosynthesis